MIPFFDFIFLSFLIYSLSFKEFDYHLSETLFKDNVMFIFLVWLYAFSNAFCLFLSAVKYFSTLFLFATSIGQNIGWNCLFWKIGALFDNWTDQKLIIKRSITIL